MLAEPRPSVPMLATHAPGPPNYSAAGGRLTDMIKLIALFKKPDDVDAFEQHYTAVHVPLIKQVPYMRNFVAEKVWGAPRGEPAYYRIAEMWFDDRASFDKAMASD